MKIGIFDSGIGGINVLKELLLIHPNNHYIYYGDNINLPYGDKTKEEINNLSEKILNFLLENKVDLIIIACGTISCTSLNYLKSKTNINIIDIISPTINYIKNSKYKNISVIATKRTIDSNIFNIENKNIIAKSTPIFVPLIENNTITKEIVENEIKDLINTDAIILGCTHYPLIKKYINNINIIDMGEILAKSLNLKDSYNKIDIYFSKVDDKLINNVKNILKKDINIIEKKL